MKQVRKYLRFKYLVPIIALFTVIFLVFILLPEQKNYENYDFIDNWEDADSEGMRGSEFINGGFKPPKRKIPDKLAKVLVKKLTNPEVTVNQKALKQFKEPNITEGIFRFKLSGAGRECSYYWVFRKTGADTYNKIEIERKQGGKIIFTSVISGEEAHVVEMESAHVPSMPYVLYLLFRNDRVVLIEQNKIVLNIADPQVRVGGFVEIDNSEFDNDSGKYAIKFIRLSRDEKLGITLFMDENLRWCGTSIKPVFPNGYEDMPNIIHLQYRDISRRVIAFPLGGRMSYPVTVPLDGFIDFEFVTLFNRESGVCGGEFPDNIFLQATVAVNNDEPLYSRKYSGLTNEFTASEKIDLSKWRGQNVEISFEFDYEGKKPKDEVIFFLANPVLRTKRKMTDRNILLISLDTLRQDHLGCYGYRKDTSPAIDRFAEKSTVFENAFTHAPWTLPAHMSLFSSMYPLESGHLLGTKWEHVTSSRLAPEIITIGEHMKAAGHKTLAVTGSGWMNSTYGFDQGIEQYRNTDPSDREEMAISTEVCRKWIEENKDTKWFIYFHTYEVHAPYRRDIFKPESSDGKAKEIIARYDSGILYADRQIDILLKALESSGQMGNTMVIIISDHGESFYKHNTDELEKEDMGHHNHNMYDNLLKVPLIIGGAPELRTKARVKTPVGLVDLLPTVLDIIGRDVPEDIRGSSVIPFIGTKTIKNRLIYAEAKAGYAHDEMKSLRSLDYKLIINSGLDDPRMKYEFYDMPKDPGEKNNLSINSVTLRDRFKNRVDRIVKSIIINNRRFKKRESGDSSSLDLQKQLSALGYLGN